MKQPAFPGHELRQRREELGVSVYEAFRKTRVPVEYLDALERADLLALPSVCYAVGFLKTYCEYLSLNPDRYVDTFRACFRPSVMRFLRNASDPALRAPAWVSELMTWAVIAGLVVLGWVAYSVVFRPRPDNVDQRVEAGTVEVQPSPIIDPNDRWTP